ncbi:MAG: Flp pilus assembly protein CpaB [Firmicutes bacterium]|mgnify:CR=1 FL=1|nr:Flp pilus assembly protein CpaB [Bacillota bacterium]
MRKRKLLLIAAALGLMAAVLTYTFIRTIEDTGDVQEVREVGVMIANTDIPSGTEVTAGMLRLAQVAETARHPDAARTPNQVIGRITKVPIVRGEQVLDSRLLPAGVRPSLTFVIPSGKRAISVAVNEVVGVAGFVKPGDRVDVLATMDSPDSDSAVTTTVLQNVEVLAIAQDMEERVDKEPKVTTTVTLAVTLAEAQRLTLAEETGVLRLALRPETAADKEWVNPTTSEQLAGRTASQAAARPAAQQPVVQPTAVRAPQPPVEPAPEYKVEVIRGTDRSTVSFKIN